MSLAQTFSSAYQVLGQKERMDDRRRQRASDQSIQDLYASGQPVDQGSIQRLLASGADPRSVASIANMLRGQDVDTARVADLQSKMKVRESPMVAGAIKKAFDTFKAKPPEEQTQMEWEKWKQTGRSMLASNGIDPELIPVDADPQTMEMQIGAGYAPGAQDLTMDREAEMGARQGRWEQGQANIDARTQATIAGADRRSALNRGAADARATRTAGAGGGGGSAKQYEFDRTMEAAGIAPGSQEYIKAARLKAGLEKREGGGGFEMSYDEEGRPVVRMGGSGKPFTEGQSKALTNITLAEGANRDMDELAAGGFDASSATGAAGVTAAQIPGLNRLAPEEAQRQNTANVAFAQSINYQRSGTATPEPEYNRAVQSVLEKWGDAPETKATKRKYRQLLVEGVKAQDGRIDVIVNQILGKASGGGTPNRSQQGQPAVPVTAGADPERAELERLRALKAAAMAGR